MTLKVAYFAPTIIAAGPVPPVDFAKIYSFVENTYINHTDITDYNNPLVNIRGGQEIQLYPSDKFNLSPLIPFLEEMCKGYMDLVSTQSVTQDLNYCEPKIVKVNTTRQQAGDYVELHTNPAGNLSGIIFTSVPDYEPGKLLSDGTDIFRMTQSRDITKFIMQDTWKYLPEPATFVLYPSHIPHAVQPWKGEGYRTVLTFDAIIKVKEEV